MTRLIEKYRAIEINLGPDGFFASASCAVHFGYCETLLELRAEIDDYLAEEAEHYGDRDVPPDTPALETAFHDYEMEV